MSDDDELISEAQKIASAKGISLADAMLEAEARLKPPPTQEDSITVTITMKPKVVAFYRKTFEGHDELSVEERMGVWLGTLLTRERGRLLPTMRATADLMDGGGPKTLPRSAFQKQTG